MPQISQSPQIKFGNSKVMQLMAVFILLALLPLRSESQCLTYHEFYNYLTNACEPCAYNCLTCLNSTVCALCADEFYLNTADNTCSKCKFGCQTCQDDTSCETCNTGLYLDSKGDCLSCATGVKSCSIAVVEECHDNYFLLGGICAGCLDNCKTCEDFVTCSQCQTGYFLESSGEACTACGSNCEVCSSASTCISCVKGFTASSNACVAEDCSAFPFCAKCNSFSCEACEQGKYLASNGTCQQSASILCEESSGAYFTDCEIDNYGCPAFTSVQTDPFSGAQVGVCLPLSATQTEEYVYLSYSESDSSCATATCAQAMSQSLEVSTKQSYYSVKIDLNVRLYSAAAQSLTVTALNSSNNNSTIASTTLTDDISLELSAFNAQEAGCSGCPYGQVFLQGTIAASGYQSSLFSFQNPSSAFSIMEVLFQFSVCSIDQCQSCTTASDCTLCISPYLLQLVSCVQSCDAGFYLYEGKYCLLECPSSTYAIQSSYQCQACVSPCSTCSSETECLSCVDGYFLEGSSCVTACANSQYFGNSTSKECEICPNPCATCEAVNSTSVKCLSCEVGYLYSSELCVFECPNGQFSSFSASTSLSQCSACSSSCTSCYINDTTCQSCASGYLLYDDTTCTQTTTCEAGFYIDTTNNVCTACQFPCSTCENSSTTCTSCFKGALYQSACHIICPDGFYTDYTTSDNLTCTACANDCLTCLSSTLCESCSTGFFLYNSTCVTVCPVSTVYPNSGNNTCTACPPPCQTCTSATECLSCSTGYLDGTACTLACNGSSYIASNFTCTQCPSPCSQCYSQTQCLQCTLPEVLLQSNSSCITTSVCEGLGKYIYYHTIDSVQEYGQCKDCTHPCATCNTSGIMCVTCETGYMLIADQSTCQESCSTSYYANSDATECLNCDSNCYECSASATNCTSCSSGMYLLSTNNSCVETCPDGYYSDNEQGSCTACQAPCATCYNVYFCKTCSTGIYYNKVCLTECPSGTIYNSSANECAVCTDNCLTCDTATSNCTTCISGYYFNSLNNTCATTCPEQYYADSYSSTCEGCISPCLTCTSSTACLSCVASYFLVAADSSCLSSCPSGTFSNSSNSSCDDCNLTICETCETSASNCLTCADGYFYDSVASLCATTCSSGYYPNWNTRKCVACSYPCTECSNTSHCSACTTNYKLYQNLCYSSCPVGYYEDNSSSVSTCVVCATNCQICTSGTTCSKCAANYYVENDTDCVSVCSAGLYAGKQDITNYDHCLSCPTNCESCSDYNTCLQCSAGLYLFNGLCLTECPILHYAETSNSTCISCPENCNTCTNSTHCTECINSYIYQNVCYLECPARTYVFNDAECIDCVSPCLQCTAEFTCTTCVSGYFYYSEYCVTACPTDVWFYPHNDSCAATCDYNKYQVGNLMYCYLEGCGGRLVELDGYCIDSCPSGYYVDQTDSCRQCAEGGDICDDLFVADFDVLRSEEFTLTLYFSEQVEIPTSADEIYVTFKDSSGTQLSTDNTPTLTASTLSQYSFTLKYTYTSLNFVTVVVSTPYLSSQETAQSLSSNQFSETVYYFNDYEEEGSSSTTQIVEIVPVLVSAGLFLVIVANFISKTSYFLQLLDFMQLVSACLYLEIQFPIVLERFLHKMTALVLFDFMPDVVGHQPYTFSPSKFIYHNVDTSLTRTHLMTWTVFFVTVVTFFSLIVANKYFQKFQSLMGRIKYRHLNDVFSIFTFPLLLFSFQLSDANTADVLIGLLTIAMTLGFIVLISVLIIQAEEMGDLQGLLSDYEPVSSRLGLMYTPFAYIRRFIVAMVFGLFPEKPLATLTLLLIFTILILICLFFYQPFTNQITDYVAIGLEFVLVLTITFLVALGLDVLEPQGNSALAMTLIVFVTLAMAGGFGWLVYLSVEGMVKYCKQKGEAENENADQDCVLSQNMSDQNNQEAPGAECENSANNLVAAGSLGERPQRRSGGEELYSESKDSNKEQFKHWNDEEDDEEESKTDSLVGQQTGLGKAKRAPEMLMKKIIAQQAENLFQEENLKESQKLEEINFEK